MAVAASKKQPSGTALGTFQLPPYKQAWPTMWYKQAESLMDMRNITNPAFYLVLVQCTLSDALQESVAHIFEADLPASEAYSQLKAELTRMHKQTSWDRLAELFAMPLIRVPSCSRLWSGSNPRSRRRIMTERVV